MFDWLRRPGRRVLVGGVLAVLLLAAALHGVDWPELGLVLQRARPMPLLAVVLATVAAYWVRARRWGELLAPLVRIGQRALFAATMLGFAASLVVPRSGEILRPWLISRRGTVSASAGFATIVLERLADLMTVLVMFALYILVLPRPAAESSSELMDAVTLGGGIAAVIAVALLALLFALHGNAPSVARVFERLLERAPRWIAEQLGKFVLNFSDGLAVIRAPAAHLALIGAQSVALWLLTAVGFHLTQLAFQIELPFQTTFLLIAFLVVGEAIPTPGLVGGFHAFYVLALVEVFGVDRTTAAAAAITAHALTTVPVFLLGLLFTSRRVSAWSV